MESVIAIEKITTRTRPPAVALTAHVAEVVTTHSGVCPICSRETRLKADAINAVTCGSCVHFAGIEQSGSAITVLFDQGKRR